MININELIFQKLIRNRYKHVSDLSNYLEISEYIDYGYSDHTAFLFNIWKPAVILPLKILQNRPDIYHKYLITVESCQNLFGGSYSANLSTHTKAITTYNGTSQNKLSTRDVKAEAFAIVLSAPNANIGSSRLSHFQKELQNLKNLNASIKIIEVTKIPEITEETNKIQKNRQKYVEAFEKINYPDHFTLELVKKRLDKYDISTLLDLQALADIMIMLCIRPTELISLRITDNEITGKSGVKWFNRFLKNYDLISCYLCKIGAVYAGQCLRHDPHNFTSPVQNYVVVNYWKIGQKPEDARPF
ncbi:hypothetical protein Glove_349g59 [Diversispora epigaea]|uniref:Uncharacterized protein n=1 Tax=Diversispora epigaea TaxID=1348612 RepID=A0A397HDM5_9GLOM|nr:hypothetical protein Glove_349g59 [Diversispora epigaea]